MEKTEDSRVELQSAQKLLIEAMMEEILQAV